MAHWLKAAEDLFEVVDRRAKLVVGEQDELSNTPTPASNGKGSQTKRSRSKPKAQKRLSSAETPTTNDASSTQNSTGTENSDTPPEKEVATSIIGNSETTSSNSSIQTTNEEQKNIEKGGSVIGAPLLESLSKKEIIGNADHEELPDSTSSLLPVASTSNEVTNRDSLNASEEVPSPISSKGVEIVHEHPIIDSEHNRGAMDSGTPIKSEAGKNHHVHVEESSKVNMQAKDAKSKVEPHPAGENPQAKKADSTPVEVQDQLDEAQGLLKSTISTGQSKEARLARVCAGLSSRLQEYKSESAQLEELLVAERELSKSYEIQIKQLQKDLSESKKEATKVESSMAEAMAAKNSEIEALVNSLDAAKKQAALAEGNLASIQDNMESIMRNRELTETRMMQALREELASVERRAEEERVAHNSTKMAAMEREVELEHRALEASTALARIQRTADERMTKAAELEQKVALLEVECASLNQELQDMEARSHRAQKKAPEEANQMIQMQAWQEELERARQMQRDAENKLSSSEAEVQKLRVEMAAMKRDAEHYSRQEHMELEKRYRELTDLLYYKQTQLEAMASEKAAAEFQLEKEMRRHQEAQVEAERSRVSRRASSSWEDDSDMKALEPLPLHHRHMAAASIQLQKAAKFLDTGAVRATRFLWRYPTARISLLCYLVFVHLFLMYLLHRLQEQADTLASREFAESMGLANHTLP